MQFQNFVFQKKSSNQFIACGIGEILKFLNDTWVYRKTIYFVAIVRHKTPQP